MIMECEKIEISDITRRKKILWTLSIIAALPADASRNSQNFGAKTDKATTKVTLDEPLMIIAI